ncbi:MAG: tetraacyldisaccharide 4'-kinase [Planctomycetaceae bacterium]|jgi:tetraacyldisaccharide 4'-kinase|nr:tetraacyldisaccharide 4'-kinase [Planctomycetaceae bacterium]
MLEEWFRQLVSCEKRGVGFDLLRLILRGVSILYGVVVWVRNFLYDHGLLKIHKSDIPVISVGNLTLGGTGKSPMVAWLCEYFISQDLRPAIISSGYRHKNTNKIDNVSKVNDEYLELAFRLPDVYHFQNRDRVAAIRELLEFVLRQSCSNIQEVEHGKATSRILGIDLVVLDDGMQHRRLRRDFEIVLLDAMEPFGYGYMFPRGMLRESVYGLRRADVVLLSRADLISAAERGRIEEFVRGIAPKAIFAEIVHSPEKIIYANGEEAAVKSIRGKNIFAFCGIGNPNAFRSTLTNNSDGQIHFEQYPDHHGYTKNDVIEIVQKALLLGVDLVLCTMKDFVKISSILKSETDPNFIKLFSNIPLAALTIQINFLTNESPLKKSLNKIF